MSNSKKLYKLVRDRIPEIIEKNGEVAEIETLSEEEYAKMLDLKLFEECDEVKYAKDTVSKAEELADLLEVIYAIADNIGVSTEQLERIRLKKQEERGAFKKRILLKSTYRK